MHHLNVTALGVLAGMSLAQHPEGFTDKGLLLREPVRASDVVEQISGECEAGRFAVRINRTSGAITFWRDGKRLTAEGPEELQAEMRSPALRMIGVACDSRSVVFDIWWLRFRPEEVEHKAVRITLLPGREVRFGPVRREDPHDFGLQLTVN